MPTGRLHQPAGKARRAVPVSRGSMILGIVLATEVAQEDGIQASGSALAANWWLVGLCVCSAGLGRPAPDSHPVPDAMVDVLRGRRVIRRGVADVTATIFCRALLRQ